MQHQSFHFSLKGSPSIEFERCTGCGACAAVCPDGVLALKDGKALAGEGIFLGCIACGHCVAICPENCISVEGRGMRPDDGIDFTRPDGVKAGFQDLSALFEARRSIREYSSRPVDREVVEQMLQAASMAPMGIPPSDVGVVVFRGQAQVAALSREAISTYRGLRRIFKPWALFLMRPFLKRNTYQTWRHFILPLAGELIEAADNGRDAFAYNAPLALLFHSGPYADAVDGAIAATYAMLAAEALGLGTCLLGVTAALNQNAQFRQKCGIPKGNTIGLGLIAGYPAHKYRRALRRRLGSVVWYED